MNGGEILPVLSGLVLGLLLVGVRPSWRHPVAFVAAMLLGFLSSGAAGELSISRFYGLLDAAVVAMFATLGFMVCHFIHQRFAHLRS